MIYLVENNLLDTTHDFGIGRSCLSHLLQHHNAFLNNLLREMNTGRIYLEFANALDNIDQGIICHRLRELGITRNSGNGSDGMGNNLCCNFFFSLKNHM